jgi:hypothetical protein
LPANKFSFPTFPSITPEMEINIIMSRDDPAQSANLKPYCLIGNRDAEVSILDMLNMKTCRRASKTGMKSKASRGRR